MELAHNTFEDVLHNMVGVSIPPSDTDSTTTDKYVQETRDENDTKVTMSMLTTVEEYWKLKMEDFNDKVKDIKNVLDTQALTLTTQVNSDIANAKQVITSDSSSQQQVVHSLFNKQIGRYKT